MRDFRKAIASVLLFAVTVTLLSAAMIVPYMKSEAYDYLDKNVRAQLAGTLDTLYLGASQSLRAFKPAVIDKAAGTSSYTLAGVLLTWHAREALLKEELDRNPLKTVYLEIAYDALQRGNEAGLEGNRYVVARLDGFWNQAGFLLRETPPGDYEKMYSLLLENGRKYYERLIKGKNVHRVKRKNRGYIAMGVNDVTLQEDEIRVAKDTEPLSGDFDTENLRTVGRIMDECAARGIKVVIVVTPLSDERVWKYTNWQAFEDELQKICDTYHCDCLDFNRLKDRGKYFDDAHSFYDGGHLGDAGANAFSALFAEIVKDREAGKDVSDRFFATYAEAKAHSPYANK